jgi:glycosyltransferase involved in cell wall biosynthesis
LKNKPTLVNKLALLFSNFEHVHLGKDVFLTPYYLAKRFGYDLTVVIPDTAPNRALGDTHRGACLHREKLLWKREKLRVLREINFFKFILLHGKSVGVLMLFHLTPKSALQALLFKLVNPAGAVYLKLDMSKDWVVSVQEPRRENFQGRISLAIQRFFLRRVEVLSCETVEVFTRIRARGLYGISVGDRLDLIPNGFDDDLMSRLGVQVRSFSEKENLMIGPAEGDFRSRFARFVAENPALEGRLLLLGNIPDKSLLFEYYNRAKIFLLTSRREGFALVFPEALYFGNYIITTDVGGAREITADSSIGRIVPVEDCARFRSEMVRVIEGKIDLEVSYRASRKLAEGSFSWSSIIRKGAHLERIFSDR